MVRTEVAKSPITETAAMHTQAACTYLRLGLKVSKDIALQVVVLDKDSARLVQE
jgi:hypothetical protein